MKSKNYSLHDGLGFLLSRLSSQMQARLDQELSAHSVTRLKWCILSSVGLEQIHSPSKLAVHIGVKRQAISRVLQQMEKEGLVSRDGAGVDGRAREVHVTPAGQKKVDICAPLVAEHLNHYRSKLSQEEYATLKHLINVLSSGEDTELDSI